MASGGGDASPPRPPLDRKGKAIVVPAPPRRKKRVIRVRDIDGYSEIPTTSTPAPTRPVRASTVRQLHPTLTPDPQPSGVRSLQSPQTQMQQTPGVRSLHTSLPQQTSVVRSLHIGSSSSPHVTPSPTPSPRDEPGRTSSARVTPPPSQTPPYRMIPVPGIRVIPTPTHSPDVGPTPTHSPDAVPTPTSSPSPTEAFAHGDDEMPDDDQIHDVEGGEHEEDEIEELPDGRPIIRVERGGFLNSKVAATAIRKTIQELYHYPWATWGELNDAEREHFFKDFRKRVGWRKSQEAVVEKLFHKKAADRLADMLNGVRKQRSRPSWMGELVYRRLQDHWNDPKYLAKCAQNKKNRASEKGGSVHTGGSISILQHAERLVYT